MDGNTKLNIFTHNFALINYDVIILFETLLCSTSSDNELGVFQLIQFFDVIEEL